MQRDPERPTDPEIPVEPERPREVEIPTEPLLEEHRQERLPVVDEAPPPDTPPDTGGEIKQNRGG